MEVTLRKAHSLAEAMRSAAAKINTPTTVDVSIYDEVEISGLLTDARSELTTSLEEAEALTAEAFSIRAMIGAANAKSGIDALLTEKAAIDATEKLFTQVSASPRSASPERAVRELEALKNAPAPTGYSARREPG